MKINYADKAIGKEPTGEYLKEIKKVVNVNQVEIGKIFTITDGIDLSNTFGTIYPKVIQTGILEIPIAADSVIGGAAELPILITGDAITIVDENGIDITTSAKDPKSDTASTTPGETDRYVFWKDSLGIWYSITNMGDI